MSTSLFHQIVFGPIHSRRLGISLGVNLLPLDGKICTFDCIYCECGYNAQRKGTGRFPERETVRAALEERLMQMRSEGVEPDVITFAGNGEPTLHPQFEAVINDTLCLRDRYFPAAKVSVLSNSTRISQPAVFRALNRVDNNILKLDSAKTEMFRLINAPVLSTLTAEEVIDGLKRFGGNLIIQTLFLRGEHLGKRVDNTTPEEIDAWLKAVKAIGPRQVMIYSIDRETPEENLEKLGREELEFIANRLKEMGLKVSISA